MVRYLHQYWTCKCIFMQLTVIILCTSQKREIDACFRITYLTTVKFTINLCLQVDRSIEQFMFPGVGG